MKKPFEQKAAPALKIDILPLSFNRHRVYILPTAYGFLFLLILLAMLLGSINYNNNLGFLLVFLLGSISLISMIHTYRNLLGIKILSISAEPVFAGKFIWFKVVVRAESGNRRAVGFMMEKEHPVVENLSAKTDETVSVNFPARSRGNFRIDRITAWTRYPLGLFRAWTVISPDVSYVVYPKPVAGPMGFGGRTGGNESDEMPAQHGADDFSGLKQYQPGEPVGRISWKSLSRGLGVFTKDFSGAGGASVMLDFDAVRDTDRERKLSRLTDMVLKAHSMNAEYGLMLPGRTIAPDKGERHKHMCLKALAMFGLNEP